MTNTRLDAIRYLILVALVLSLLPAPVLAAPAPAPALQASTFPVPAVAIHVSELTQALETMTASPPTPAGVGTTGHQWWPTWWRYFVMYESLKEALRSDGTPFVTVSDADIAAGRLLNPDGSPTYPIVISLASEAIADAEIAPLRAYVSAGGFLLVGSSAFTRNPNGTTRGDFALANEMGLHMVNTGLQNWAQNTTFTKVMEHRLVSHIPSGTLIWRMPLTSEDISWGVSPSHTFHGNHYVWQVHTVDATVVADGDNGPLLATKSYGQGQFIYHGAMQPLIGHGGHDSGMYAYGIYRNVIEWAFASADLPIIKLSPWRYPYDAAFMARHDFEHDPALISSIEASAQFEASLGVKGDYYFTTGAIRIGSEDTRLSNEEKTDVIASLRRAVSLYGATIGSHNGGLKNPVNLSLQPGEYHYWHWGPDEALDTTPPGYASGKAYAYSSIRTSFLDIEDWLSGLDNGRSGCGIANNCPRTWVSPYFNSTREASYDILQQLGAITMGEQKIGPFPHWTLSTETAAKRYASVTPPVSDWYIGNSVAQSLESGFSTSTVQALVDAYYNLGALINLYGHSSSASGLQQEYITYSAAKPGIWATNAVDVYDWWVLRSGVVLTPSFSQSGETATASATIANATDPDTAIEMILPNWNTASTGEVQVLFNGAPADPTSYRTTSYGLKVRVGATVSSVQVNYSTVLQTWTQSDWSGGPGQGAWVVSSRYQSASGIDNSTAGQIGLSITSGGNVLFADDFGTTAPAPLPPWISQIGSWTVSGGILQGSGSTNQYSNVYTSNVWTDFSVEGRFQLPAGAFGGGIGGRVNPTTGARYAAWIYPAGSPGGSNVIKLIKFRDWTTWSGAPMQLVGVPNVGPGWHTLKMALDGNRIRVYYDGNQVIDVTDSNYDSRPPYASGGVSVDMFTGGAPYVMLADDVVVRSPAAYTNSGALLSSAFDGGAGAQWHTISWDATAAGSTNVRVRTRTANQLDQLGSAPWSAYYTTSGSQVTSPDARWIQYEVELTTSAPATSPVLSEMRISYVPAASPAWPVSIAASAPGIVLSWQPVPGATEYQVYGSAQPYFTPIPLPGPNANLLTTVGTATSYTDSSSRALFFYIVRAVIGSSGWSDSSQAGRFTFAIAPGTSP